METALMFSQTLFYLVVSLAIIVLAVLCSVVTFHLIGISRELEKVSRNLHTASEEAGERIKDLLDRLSDLPILSYLLKRSKSRAEARKKV